MTAYRCVNDIFAYCSTHPNLLPQPSNPIPDGPSMPTGGICSKNPKNCRSFRLLTQLDLKAPEKTNYRRTRTQKKAIKKEN